MTSSPASICVCVHVRVSAPWVAPVQVKACACVHLLGGIKIVIDYSLTEHEPNTNTHTRTHTHVHIERHTNSHHATGH